MKSRASDRGACPGLGRELINLPGGRLCQSPLCPDSDQIPLRSEMTRCANLGLALREPGGLIHLIAGATASCSDPSEFGEGEQHPLKLLKAVGGKNRAFAYRLPRWLAAHFF